MYAKENTSVQTGGRCITQRAKMSIDPKFIELTADVFRRILKMHSNSIVFSTSWGMTEICHIFVDWVETMLRVRVNHP